MKNKYLRYAAALLIGVLVFFAFNALKNRVQTVQTDTLETNLAAVDSSGDYEAPVQVEEQTTAVHTEEEVPGEKDEQPVPQAEYAEDTIEESSPALDENGSYTSKDEVALYIHLYGHLPRNYITKKQAQAAGWSSGQAVSSSSPGKSIGGDRFGNYEGLLPKKKGRSYTECDIDAYGKKSRGAKRIVFSNDGLIYYTDDHYESFELLYGEE